MENIDPKELVRLAAACRKAGIKTFKGNGIEFTLTDDIPATQKRRSSKKSIDSNQSLDSPGRVETDGPTEEELLMWSTGGGIPVSFEGEQ